MLGQQMKFASLHTAIAVVLYAAWTVGHLHAERPNVIVIMSDDQGVGDYGFMGNPLIRTPSLDQMYSRSGYLSNFYVSNVCAPTRASLMTGRYNYRTRCIDTFLGRAMMDPEEVTLAEQLRDAGYRTGIYGKWHLGDNYPMRAMDQGFQESLVHRGGGIGQPSDPIGAEGKYTDPTLFRNGEAVNMTGYCTDIYFDAAMEFIETSTADEKSFFTYIATNAPHGPFHDVPTDLYSEYQQVDFSPIVVGPLSEERREAEFDKLARISAMITNIDQNVGRLFKKLEQLEILDNTIVIYLNDNGPNSRRYVGNMRGMKTEVHDGGIRSPLLFHWPAKVKANATSNAMCAHIDIFPTILDACEVDSAGSNRIDGRSFLPLLTEKSASWPNRPLVFQSHRGNIARPFHHFALHEGHWKLVHPSGFGKEQFDGEAILELYNLADDPTQQTNLAETHVDVLDRLKRSYQKWFDDVASTRPNNWDPPRIVIGTRHERESVLTRQDWRHKTGKPWARDSTGSWMLQNPNEQEFEIEVIVPEGISKGDTVVISAGDKTVSIALTSVENGGHKTIAKIPAGQFSFEAKILDGEDVVGGAHQVILTAIEVGDAN